jgi:hypothetical protein
MQRLEPDQSRNARGFDSYIADFRHHFETTYAAQGYPYDQLAAAYQYGYALGTDERYGRSDWAAIETEARSLWEKDNRGTWEEFKGAVHYAWDKVRPHQ